MPDRLASNNSLSEITRGINNKLQEAKAAKTSFNNDENNDDKNVDSHQDKDTVCVQKVMQVAQTVWEEKVICHHKFSEKCHNTFITDYVPTQEKKMSHKLQQK